MAGTATVTRAIPELHSATEPARLVSSARYLGQASNLSGPSRHPCATACVQRCGGRHLQGAQSKSHRTTELPRGWPNPHGNGDAASQPATNFDSPLPDRTLICKGQTLKHFDMWFDRSLSVTSEFEVESLSTLVLAVACRVDSLSVHAVGMGIHAVLVMRPRHFMQGSPLSTHLEGYEGLVSWSMDARDDTTAGEEHHAGYPATRQTDDKITAFRQEFQPTMMLISTTGGNLAMIPCPKQDI